MALSVIALILGAATASARPDGSAEAAESLAVCENAEALTGDARAEALARGMQLADDAIAANPRDALAHFATVCNLGKQMEMAGIGFCQLMNLRRIKKAADRTLELAPNDADALAAKGVLLLRLPRLFGGDPEEAEELLRRAVAAEPDNGTALCYLGKALDARGATEEARALRSHC